MTDQVYEDRGSIDIGRVIQETFAVVGRNFATFGLLALVLVGVPAVIVGWFMPAQDPANPLAFFNGVFIFGMLVSVALAAVLQAAVIYGTVQDMNGQKPAVGDALATGLRAFLPVIVTSFLLGVVYVIAFCLLFVPVFIAIAFLVVTIPALVAERLGIFDSFGRSVELTAGSRWKIFALTLIFLILYFVVSAVVGAVTGGEAMRAAMQGEAYKMGLVPIVVSALVNTVLALVGAAGSAVLYVELRKVREGGSGWLREIFA